MLQESFCFTVEMAYKPPVKSSVKKIYDRRFQPESTGEPRRTNSQKAAYAATFAPPASSGTAGFEQRMRDILFGSDATRTDTKSDPRRNLSIPSNVITVDNLRDYKTIVGDESSRIVVTRFHATYCRACMAVAPHFYKIAKLNPNVVFVDVPVTESNAALHQGLGVPSLPYGHIYHPQEGLVEEMKLTRNNIPEFREKLKGYTDGLREIPEHFMSQD